MMTLYRFTFSTRSRAGEFFVFEENEQAARENAQANFATEDLLSIDDPIPVVQGVSFSVTTERNPL